MERTGQQPTEETESRWLTSTPPLIRAFRGALAVTNSAGTWLKTWDMPTTKAGKKEYNVLDLPKLRGILAEIKSLPEVTFALENPTTRPDEEAERSARFGRQLGILETALYFLQLDHVLISPQLWTGRLGLPGKTHEGWDQMRIDLFNREYPGHEQLIRGPKGGLLDGRLDAFLIAHYIRTTDQAVNDLSGKGSMKHLAQVLSGRGKRRGQLPKFV